MPQPHVALFCSSQCHLRPRVRPGHPTVLPPHPPHTVWGYLRTSLTCAGREELLGAADSEDLAALQAALPLE